MVTMPLTISPAQVEKNPRNIRLCVFFPEPEPERRQVVSQPFPSFRLCGARHREKISIAALGQMERSSFRSARWNQCIATNASPTRKLSSVSGGGIGISNGWFFAGAFAGINSGITIVMHNTNQNSRVYWPLTKKIPTEVPRIEA